MANEDPYVSLSDLTDQQILEMLEGFNKDYQLGILDLTNTAQVSDNDLTNVVVGLNYLTGAGLISEDQYSDISKAFQNELDGRVGDLPMHENDDTEQLDNDVAGEDVEVDASGLPTDDKESSGDDVVEDAE